jgi:hypothetical protein
MVAKVVVEYPNRTRKADTQIGERLAHDLHGFHSESDLRCRRRHVMQNPKKALPLLIYCHESAIYAILLPAVNNGPSLAEKCCGLRGRYQDVGAESNMERMLRN